MRHSPVFPVWRRYPSFKLLQYSNILTNFVNWGAFIAMLELLVTITHNGMAMGVLWSVSGLLPLVCNAFVGVWVARFDARTSFPVTEALRGVVTLGFILVPAVHSALASYALFLITRFLLGVLGSYSATARQTVIPDLIRPADLTTANSLNFVIDSVIRLTGASFGGVMLTFVSINAMWLISALSFLVSAWWIRRAVRGMQTRAKLRTRSNLLQEFRVGLGVVRRDKWVLMVILTDVAAGVLIGSYNLMLQLFVKDVYHAKEYALSVLYVSEGLLSAITGYILANLKFLFRTRAAYAATYAFTGLMWMAFGLSHDLYQGMICLALYAIAGSKVRDANSGAPRRPRPGVWYVDHHQQRGHPDGRVPHRCHPGRLRRARGSSSHRCLARGGGCGVPVSGADGPDPAGAWNAYALSPFWMMEEEGWFATA